MLDNTPNQPSKVRTKSWVEINDDSRGMYNHNSQIKCKMSMLKSLLYDYSDPCILVIGTLTVWNTRTATNLLNKKKYNN